MEKEKSAKKKLLLSFDTNATRDKRVWERLHQLPPKTMTATIIHALDKYFFGSAATPVKDAMDSLVFGSETRQIEVPARESVQDAESADTDRQDTQGLGKAHNASGVSDTGAGSEPPKRMTSLSSLEESSEDGLADMPEEERKIMEGFWGMTQ